MPRVFRWPRTANVFFPYLKPSERIGWRGALHKSLVVLGPSWRSSPLRRLVQSASLVLFFYALFYVCWPYSQPFSATTLSDKQWFPVETFLLIDPLVGVSTALAGRVVNGPTLVWTAGILLVCVLVPRAFCGYLCPLGTLIDASDWLVGRRFRRLHCSAGGPASRGWTHIRYYLLFGVLVASLGGVLLAGYVSAIPVLTRGLVFTAGRWQLGLMKGPGHLLAVDWTYWTSVVLFAGTFLASLFGKRFWCRCLCPSGAMLSCFSLFRLVERKVGETCSGCGKCIAVCPLDAIDRDFTTRTSDCAFCQSCGGVCPTHSIQYIRRQSRRPARAAARAEMVCSRWSRIFVKCSTVSEDSNSGQRNSGAQSLRDESSVRQPAWSRRGFLAASVVGTAAAAPGLVRLAVPSGDRPRPIRPPGSVAEAEFLALCIRCGECFKVCPGPVLHPAGLEYGLDALWTPVAHPEHAGCHQDCNFCTQVCPTGAIEPLELAVKRRTPMGLAWVDPGTCLPLRNDKLRQDCTLCYDECEQAGYHAIERQEIRIELDPPPPEGMFSEIELEAMSRIRVPVVRTEACIGCGICQYRCQMRNVVQEGKLAHSAIQVRSGRDGCRPG